jgi:voltage-gated potassium channel
MGSKENSRGQLKPWQEALHRIIFGTETWLGRAFDIALLYAIIISILAVMLESVEEIRQEYGHILILVEWVFTILFSIEYTARIISARRPLRYIFSFYGIIDFMAVIPTYLTLIFANTQYLVVIRAIRLLRVFRILKLGRFLGESEVLVKSLTAARHKIAIFLGVIVTVVTIMGTLMYLIEPAEAGFTSIPQSIYWAIVTLTTVGYGDIAPQTFLGKTIASLIMIIGYAIIAVPTGIVTSEMVKQSTRVQSNRHCPDCLSEKHESDAKFCKHCGGQLAD